jgi:IS30 family transposase
LKNGTVKVIPPLDPLAIRVISPRFLSEDERIQVADMASRGAGPTTIGAAL